VDFANSLVASSAAEIGKPFFNVRDCSIGFTLDLDHFPATRRSTHEYHAAPRDSERICDRLECGRRCSPSVGRFDHAYDESITVLTANHWCRRTWPNVDFHSHESHSAPPSYEALDCPKAWSITFPGEHYRAFWARRDERR
jgi:hypothetical protein